MSRADGDAAAKAAEPPLPAALFERADELPDTLFYAQPRFVNHIDDDTIAALTRHYEGLLFPGADVLDLMSSWVSHLPTEPTLGRVAGLGMNEPELARNPRLTEYLVHDLNAAPSLPYEAAAFDFVFIAVSIQYLTQPIAVFSEIARVLRPGGMVVVSTSHRCFPTKAVRAFHVLDPNQRVRLLGEYVIRAGGFGDPEFLDRSPPQGDPLWIVAATRC